MLFPAGVLPFPVREFAFELALCAHLEGGEGPGGDALLSRQLGAHVHGRRVVDVLAVDPGPEFAERAAITPERIPTAAVEADVGPGRARYWKDAFDCHPERAERAKDLAVERGFFEAERRGGRTYVRQVARYPDWFGSLVAIENKPDLGRPGDLEMQLRTDVSLGLVDEVVLATASHVTRAHLNRIPDEVGVWRFDPETGEREVIRDATPLAVDDPGVEVVESYPGRTDVRVVGSEEKQRARRRLAERAYGKGWRTFDYPACAQCSPDDDGLPQCAWKGRSVRASDECGTSCAGYEESEAVAVDTDSLRAERSPWEPEPAGRKRQQSGLDRFG
ncbi:hypothetical protein SAMN05216559_3921 [Halomicrobium zhouii]|uniref:Uncharacterized protein n=1 Tax=Halomicrobium zhouii TaxID=767519 RepID=A0A1I6M7F5_9EURY|nr:hypothetical protein SAMN05216559_3921 [Halomicrobium zhouii]